MLILSVLLFFNRGYAQQVPVPLKRSHQIAAGDRVQGTAATGDLTLLAVRVEFQSDDNRFTSGNGTFGPNGRAGLPYLAGNTVSIDPLPHDRNYFEAHLEFAKNYFETVSGGNLSVEYRVLPAVYKLDRRMEAYAPTGEQFTNEKLALLARDVWEEVEENGGFDTSGLDPAQTAFILFHAGVGRDIELTGTSLDKTPQDIPSLYLDRNSLSRLLGEPGFDGFPVNGGTFKIRNSMILPRTLSRRGEDVSGNEFVLQLSTNGLICASIGSHLGLPDLFNPVTGASGIGRFGLMDGAGIFSYSGLFPPEPSAWEKVYLDWLIPYDIDLDDPAENQLAAVSLRQENSSIAKYAISRDEYFLLENRHRDPGGNGVELTFRRPGGTLETKTFTNLDEAFVFQESGFEDLLVPGVVVEVSDYDWSLPGGLDPGPDNATGTGDDRLLNGGILIWHIDEAVIDRQLSARGVNADPERRGVDLEEADGAQDIGRESKNPTIDLGNGSAFDFWWKDNNASVITPDGDTLSLYRNRFGPSTHPDNSSNSGATSFFEFFGFSENRPVATFRARRVDELDIKKEPLAVDRLPDGGAFNPGNDLHLNSYPLGLSIYGAPPDSFLIVPTRNTVFAIRLNGQADPLFDFQIEGPRQPFVGQTLVLGTRPADTAVDLQNWGWISGSWQNRWNNSGTAARGFVSTLDGSTLLLDFTRDRFDLDDGLRLTDLPSPELRTASAGGEYGSLSENGLTISGNPQTIPVRSDDNRLYAGALQITRDESAFYLLEDRALYLIDPGPDDASPKRLLFESESPGWPAFADFDLDGRLDVLYADRTENTLNAVNINGALLGSFPIQAPEGNRFAGTPLVADLEGDRSLDLIIATQDSVSLNLYAYNSDGEIKSGFPLYVGGVSDPANEPVHPLFTGKTLYAVSHNGDLKAWEFPNLAEIRWGSLYGNEPYHNKVTGRITGSRPPSAVSSVLVQSETYNWPNPAKDQTYIRYQTDGPGEVEVRIITMSGRLVFSRDYDATGGPPEEQRIQTSDWESGIYLAKITANVNGRESSKLIRIAVVH